MGTFRQFPYTNFHEINLDWLLKMMCDLELEWEDFTVNWSEEVKNEVDKWLEEHPEATTTVLDGSISTVKLADGAVTFDKVAASLLDDIYNKEKIYEIDNLTISKRLLKNSNYTRAFVSRKLKFAYINDTSYGLQSAEYVDSLDHIILGFTDGLESGICKLVEVEKDFQTVIRVAEGLSLGHVNDLAYNPATNKLYAATMTTGVYANQIAIIDPETLTITGAIDVQMPIYQLSYDRTNNVFYAGSNYSNYIFDADFNIINTTNIANFDTLFNETTTGQGSCVYEGNYILLRENDNSVFLITHNYNTGVIEQVQEYTNILAGDEAEAIVNIPNDGLYVISGQGYISAYKLKTKQIGSDEDMFNIFASGNRIVNNSDLNDFVQPGKYFTLDGASTDTLLNRPVELTSRGIVLLVFSQAFNWLTQVIIGTGNEKSHMYTRQKSLTGTWSDWRALQAEARLITSNPVAVNGTAQIPGNILSNYKVITITCARGRYAGSVTLPTSSITAGDVVNGICIMARHDQYWELGISTTGLITNKAQSGVSDPYIKIAY